MTNRSCWLKVLLAVGCLAAVAAAAPTWHGDKELSAQELERQWPQIADAQRTLPIRGTLRFALEAAGIGWHSERVAAALGRARAMQDLDAKSAMFGNFKWRSDHPRVLDQNGVEFAMQLLGLLRSQHATALAPEARALLDAMMLDGVAGLSGHSVRIEYTNIFVMKCWGLIAAGEALGRADIADDGYRRFDDWLRHTARHGIGEYGAVTYYGVDLDSLGLIAKFAARADARAKAGTAIRYLWADIAANWWAPGDRLGGANARSYDYLFGRGYLEAHTWTAGWLRERPGLEGAGWIGGVQPNQVVLREAVMLRPPGEWTEPIRTQVPRTVVQRWGDKPEQRAVHWVGQHVSLASSGASRGTDERTLVANLGDSPAVPQLTLFMDGRGDPFGTKKTANAAGQAKSLHLTPFVATVQRGGEVLQWLADEPRGPGSRYKAGELACFLTHLTVPRGAQLWTGERVLAPGREAAPAVLPPGASVFLRMGDAAIAVRFLVATSVAGPPAAIHWIEDAPDGPARRLTVVHATAEPKPGDRGSVAVWLRAAEGLDEAGFAAWRRAFAADGAQTRRAGAMVSLEVAGEAGPLRIEADFATRERRVLAGGEPEGLLGVNGRDIGRELLAEFGGR
ncbi:MAG: hypothetical protein HZA93_27285 [Verrucomicrobia bacterium]|nr:hypothetical protein [Verrucomicrobiota bacterium]